MFTLVVLPGTTPEKVPAPSSARCIGKPLDAAPGGDAETRVTVSVRLKSSVTVPVMSYWPVAVSQAPLMATTLACAQAGVASTRTTATAATTTARAGARRFTTSHPFYMAIFAVGRVPRLTDQPVAKAPSDLLNVDTATESNECEQILASTKACQTPRASVRTRTVYKNWSSFRNSIPGGGEPRTLTSMDEAAPATFPPPAGSGPL
jgi:hypothetical protein